MIEAEVGRGSLGRTASMNSTAQMLLRLSSRHEGFEDGVKDRLHGRQYIPDAEWQE
jgi:hypothetical protein